MQLRKLLKPLALCLSLSACQTGPKVAVYVSNPEHGGMEWYDAHTGSAGFSHYSDTDNFVCFNPTDAQALLTYCGVKDAP